MTDLPGYLRVQSEAIERALDHLVPAHRGSYQQLYEAARYALLGGGKRIRPILALAVVEACGKNSEEALLPCCALELIHAYSLIHDDLPCMDDDDFRRGKPTVHRQYSEGMAVLVGDFLLTYAFEVLAKAKALSAEKRIALIETLTKASGGVGMIAGQVMDISHQEGTAKLEELEQLHRCKTGALLTASILFGGILSDLNQSLLDQLRLFGENIGLAFQIVDDILDVTASEAKHGRLVATDLRNQKATYVTLLGLEQAKHYAQQHYNQALLSLKGFPYPTQRLVTLADYVIHRKN